MNARERARARTAARRSSGIAAELYASRLRAGERVEHYSDHHAGMAVLVAELYGPRPAGATLSLVNPTSSSAYLGTAYRAGVRVPYVLSTAPADYVWESQAANAARGNPTADASVMAALGARA